MKNRLFQIALLQSGHDSIHHLALSAGIERTRLTRIANGWVTPRPDELARISRALRCNAADLLAKQEQVDE